MPDLMKLTGQHSKAYWHARKYCACWTNNIDKCWKSHNLAHQPYSDLLIVKPGECVIAYGSTCQYFRDAVYPAAPSDVQAEYRTIDATIPEVSERFCPECGGPVLKNKVICAKCRKKHKAAQNKKTYQKNNDDTKPI